MDEVVPIVTVLFFVFLLSRGFGEITLRLRLPALIGEIIAGIVIANLAVGSFHLLTAVGLAPSTLAGAENQSVVSALAEVAVVFLVFAVGLEVRPEGLRRFARLSATTAMYGILVPFGLGVTFLLALEGPSQWAAALFVGVALLVSSLIGTARFLGDHHLLDTMEAHVILGALVIEDIVGVIVLTVVLGVTARADQGPVTLVYQVLVVVVFAVAFGLFFLYIAPRLLRQYAHPSSPDAIPVRLRTRNATFVLALLFCLGASALAESFQLAGIAGAFFAGMALSEFREQYDLRSRFEAINTFLVPFFFVKVGLTVSTGDLVAAWPLAAALTVLAVAGKLIGSLYESRKSGRGPALRIGAGLVDRGEVGIIVAITAFDAAMISADLYTAIVVMSVATSVIGPYLLYRWFRTRLPSEPPAAPEAEPAGL